MQLSGIITTMMAAIAFKRYSSVFSDPTSVQNVVMSFQTIQFISQLAEIVVFFSMGLSFLNNSVDTETSSYSVSLLLWSFLLAIFSRGVYIYPLAAALNWFHERRLRLHEVTTGETFTDIQVQDARSVGDIPAHLPLGTQRFDAYINMYVPVYVVIV